MAIMAVAVLLVTLGGGNKPATAAVNSITVSPASVAAGGTATVTINADPTGTPVTVTVPTGTLTDCLLEVAGVQTPCVGVTLGTGSITIGCNTTGGGYALQNCDTIVLEWTAPATGPAVATVTATQGASTFTSGSVTVVGPPASVTLEILERGSTSASSCAGEPAEVIALAGAAQGLSGSLVDDPVLKVGVLCAIVRDASNNLLPNQPVNFTVTPNCAVIGGAGAFDSTGPTTAAAPALGEGTGQSQGSTISAGSCTSGQVVTVRAASGSFFGTDTVTFGGVPLSCSMTPATPGSVNIGQAATITVRVSDQPLTSTGAFDLAGFDTGGHKAPDDVDVFVVQTNPGAGQNAAIIPTENDIENGVASFAVIAAISGQLALGATVLDTGSGTSVNCATSLTATGVVQPAATGTAVPCTAPGTITGGTKPPATGGFGLFVFCGGTYAQMEAAACGSSVTDAYWVTDPAGNFVQFVPQTTVSVVNAGWIAMFPGGVIPNNQPIIGKCV